MTSFRSQFVSLTVAAAILLQFLCCATMPKAAELPTARKAVHSCCGESTDSPKSNDGKPGDPIKQCPIMSGDHVGMNHVVQPTSVTPDFAAPIIALTLDVLLPPTVSLSRDLDDCFTATSPPADLFHQHCQLLLQTVPE